ncbi:DUF982 domain-containing protein [Oryzicola mucosus]|uniref:DUF982 domain-containing protein n=1 Tax=Oryzicola mucosus TaxID=2767425 RepID=A0A8J6U8V1_9HYPH|nr:DUF982 domain-containing protein [Oryzicola mucosus]MBD0416202.1 DUF982 domain-containing protein [Oryzicola mucosus]
MSEDKSFSQPVVLHIPSIKRDVHIRDASQALNSLTSLWPSQRGARHRDAVETCLKVLDGHRSAEDARMALIEAAREAGLLAGRSQPSEPSSARA